MKKFSIKVITVLSGMKSSEATMPSTAKLFRDIAALASNNLEYADRVKAPVLLRDNFRLIENKADSIADLIEEKEATVAAVSTARKAIREYLAVIDGVKRTKRTSAATVDEIENTLSTMVNAAKDKKGNISPYEGGSHLERSFQRFADDAANALKGRDSHLDMLPTIKDEKTKLFAVIRHPIVPIFETYVGPEVFKKAGLRTRSMGSNAYTILEGQLLVGANAALMREEGYSKTQATKQVEKFVKVLASKTGKKLTLMYGVSKPRTKMSSPFIYYWVLPTSVVTALSREISMPDEWGFFS